MEDEQTAEWYDFQTKASAEVSRGRSFLRRGVPRVFRFCESPSFEEMTGIEVYDLSLRCDESAYCGIITVWRRDLDREKFRTPVERLKHPRDLEPTIERQEVEIDARWFEGVLERLAKVSIPVRPREAPGGLDGTSYSLEIGDSLGGLELSWWCDGPEEWHPVIAIADEIGRKIRKARAR